MNEDDCVPIKLYLQKQVAGQIWTPGSSLATPDLPNCGDEEWGNNTGSKYKFDMNVTVLTL